MYKIKINKLSIVEEDGIYFIIIDGIIKKMKQLKIWRGN